MTTTYAATRYQGGFAVVEQATGRVVHTGFTSILAADVAAVRRTRDSELVGVDLVDGSRVTIARGCVDRFVGLDDNGYRVLTDPDLPGFLYPVTDCCGASGKGSECGVVCRACYQPVADDLGADTTVAIPVAK